jgi:hypothetical protein
VPSSIEGSLKGAFRPGMYCLWWLTGGSNLVVPVVQSTAALILQWRSVATVCGTGAVCHTGVVCDIGEVGDTGATGKMVKSAILATIL